MNAHASENQTHTATEGTDVAFTFVLVFVVVFFGGFVVFFGFQHIVKKVQRVLADETADASRIVRVIGSEPVLAAQLVRMANSAALNPGRMPITDL